MIRAFIFMVKIALIAGVIIFIAGQEGSIALTWGEYTVNSALGVFLVVGLVLFLCLMFVLKAIDVLLHIPDVLARKRMQKRHDKGYKYLTRGLSAVAAGNADQAKLYAEKTHAYMPDDKGLSLLLQAQAAQLNEDKEAAQLHFKTLMSHPDAKFLGVRGLLSNVEDLDDVDVLNITQTALKSYPNHAWLLQTLYQTQCHQHDWAVALKTLTKMEKYNDLSDEKTKSDKSALYIMRGREADQKGFNTKAIRFYKKALQANGQCAPALIDLIDVCIRENKARTARTFYKNAWRDAPHYETVHLWGNLIPQSKAKTPEDRIKWFEQLIALNDKSLSYLACAKECAEQGLWAKANKFMSEGEKHGDIDQRYYQLWRDMLYRDPTATKDDIDSIQEKIINAAVSKQWICSHTGHVFSFWQPFSGQSGAPFNSIIWSHEIVRGAKSAPVMII